MTLHGKVHYVVRGGESVMLMQNIPNLVPVSQSQSVTSTAVASPAAPLHVAIICDGNGRWATTRGLTRTEGHRAGAETARRVIRCAPHLGVGTLTMFTLSSANWARPAAEVDGILNILQEYLMIETSHCLDEGIRLSVIGRRDRLPVELRESIVNSEALTARGSRLHLRLAIDYSSRQCIYQ